MAKDKSSKKSDQNAGAINVPIHPVAKQLQGDAMSHAHLITLTGYPGESTIEGNFRLYLHHDFQSYYEIREADVAHYWPPITDETTEPVRVAIDAEVTPHLVIHTKVSSAAAALLKGDMVASLLKDAIESASTFRLMDRTPPPPPPAHGWGGVLRRRSDSGEPVE
jgi:hypothetical protein